MPDVATALDEAFAVYNLNELGLLTRENFAKLALQSWMEDDSFTCTANTDQACASELAEFKATIQDDWCGYVYKDNLERAERLDEQAAAAKNDGCFVQWL